jgi:hypothetical protein
MIPYTQFDVFGRGRQKPYNGRLIDSLQALKLAVERRRNVAIVPGRRRI